MLFVGFDVFAEKEFAKGDFLLVYRGDLIDEQEARVREEKYRHDKLLGSFVYEFQHAEKTML